LERRCQIMGKMKTVLRLAIILVLSGCAVIFFSHEAVAERIVKVGVYENKPLVFLDKHDIPRGIFIDLLERIASVEQWTLKYVPGSWTECLGRLETGEIDLLTAIAYAAVREKKYNFTYETVITNWGQVFVPKSSTITSVLDLESKKIAVKMQDIHFLGLRDLTAKFNMECRFIEADGYDVVFELIEAKRVDAGVVNRLVGLQNKPAYPVKETPIMFNPIEVRYAAPKSADTDLLTAIDVHLRRMQLEKDPFYTQTLNSWLAVPVVWELPNAVKYALVGVAFVLLLFVAMNLTLRVKVKNRTEALSRANTRLQNEVRTRERAEDNLRKYERIVATSTDHMALIDLSYSYQALNDAALKAVGQDAGEVIGKKIWEVLKTNGSQIKHQKRLDRAFSGQVVKYRSWMSFPKEGRRYMDIVFTPIVQADKQITGCVANYRDITERHELELKLENAQKMEFMGTIAGGVAHDLNNILSGIVSYPDLLLMQVPEDSAWVKPLQTIKKSGEKAAVIVQDLLTLARRGVANKQPVDLNEIITVFLNSPEWHKIISFHPQVRMRTKLAEDLKPISGSPVHLSKTVMNLISNAAEALPEGGEVAIVTQNRYLDESKMGDTTFPSGEYVLLQVSDNGIGISKEDLSKIFEPFYTKKVMGRSGTGLGLAVVWGTVQDHQGTIDVISETDCGTTFNLFFPASDDEVHGFVADSPNKGRRGGGETILIVDDIDAQRVIASDILTELGYTVTTVSSGEMATSRLTTQPFDLVILDMLMPPGMDGLATYEEILKILPGQKAIIASGFAETERVKKALDLGVGQFIRKPYTIDDVGNAVKQVLAQ
jgi:two-component system cell cycle sensor histidine kinase/response regulator CckA